jgi:predicted MPP superfamily phosphohydrolase
VSSGGASAGVGSGRARAGLLVGAAAAAGLAWAWFEAGWLRVEQVEVTVPELPSELDGLRIAHLSDFHLGVPSRGRRATERAVAWVEDRRPDIVTVTGDLLTRSKGAPVLRELVARLAGVAPTFLILGNHDFAISRDPFADRSPPLDLSPARLLSDAGATIELRGRRVYVAGADPRSRWVRSRPQPEQLAVSRADADLRILLLHYPRLVDGLPQGAFDLVLAGHMHGGQINLPYPGGKLHLAHLRARFTRGLYVLPAATMHVSAGLGTTFVPFRFAARPEASELVLRGGAIPLAFAPDPH